MSTPKLTMVLAQSLEDFERKARQLAKDDSHAEYWPGEGRAIMGKREYRYASDPYKVRGFHGFTIERWGNWWLHPEGKLIEVELEVRRFEDEAP